MSDTLHLHYTVDGEDFTRAGEASAGVKKTLRQIGVSPDAIRRVAIVLYEGEINMVIHANGGQAMVDVGMDQIVIRLIDQGPGIPDMDKAMQEGWSTAGENARDLGFGAGMGLPNMKRYADDMTIETTIGVGTAVTMTIKL